MPGNASGLAAPSLLVALAVACGAGRGTSPTAPGDSDAGAPDVAASPPAATRSTTPLEHWLFRGTNDLVGAEAPSFDESSFAPVTVPHTWNGKALPIVAYSHAWYRTRFSVSPADAGRRVYVVFDGVGVVADVFVNGTRLGEHRGSYTRFVFDATDAVHAGDDNVLAVMADNTDDDTLDCLPARAIARRYYEPYGGIYRRAQLLVTDPIHVDPTDFGSSGVYLTPRTLADGSGTLTARTRLVNASGARAEVRVDHRVLDASGVEVARFGTTVSVDAGARIESSTGAAIAKPLLWSPGEPNLYSVVTEVSAGGVVRDSVTERFGFRTFRIGADGFFVNGVSTPLRGVAKHQETEAHQAAVTDDELRADWDGLVDLGVNYVRLAHYPHAKLEYDLADERGIVVWAENGFTTPTAWSPNADRLTREMVRQTYNHPSIAFYSAGNESVSPSDAASVDAVVRFAKAIRDEDPSRLVTYADNQGFSDPVFDFVAHNLYEGLGGADPWLFESDASAVHYVSENGGRATVTQHADYASVTRTSTFEPEELIQPIAEASFEAAFRTKTSSIPLFTWWAYRDFQLEGRIHGICNNGVVTYDGAHKKDHYFLFQSFLRPTTPVVHLAGSAYVVRRGSATNPIKAYSNAATLRLTVNGEDAGVRANGDYQAPNGRVVHNVFAWTPTLHAGTNVLRVDDGAGHADSTTIVFDGQGGAVFAPPVAPLVASVASSNASNVAYYVDREPAPDVPVYYGYDGTADNSFGALPQALSGARWIATKRLSDPANATTLTLTAGNAAVDVFVLVTDDGQLPSFLTGAGFVDANLAGTWRDNGMNVVRWAAWSMRAAAGATVSVPSAVRDYVVLVRAVTNARTP